MAYCIQLIVDARPGTRRWVVLLTVLAIAAAAGLVVLSANSDFENGYLVELPSVVAVVISLVSALLIEGAFLVAFLVFVFPLGFDPWEWEPRPRMVRLPQWRVCVALVLLIVLVPLVGRPYRCGAFRRADESHACARADDNIRLNAIASTRCAAFGILARLTALDANGVQLDKRLGF